MLIALGRTMLGLTQGMSPASNLQPGSEQLLMPPEENKSGVVVQLYFQLFSLKPFVL